MDSATGNQNVKSRKCQKWFLRYRSQSKPPLHLKDKKSDNILNFVGFLLMGLFRLFYIILVFSTVRSQYVHYKILQMAGFEPRPCGIRCDRSANGATTLE